MKTFHLGPDEDSPEVVLDNYNQIMRISGRSFLEDTEAFYKPIIDWLVDYCLLPDTTLELHFKFIYFSTATTKTLVKLLGRLEAFAEKGKKISIHWHYAEDDDDILDAGKEFEEILNLLFVFHSYRS
jgi:hypothetical protein